MKIRHHLNKAKAHVIFGLIFLAMILLFLWPRIVISIKPGEAGVLYSRFLGGTVQNMVYGEGVHFIPPWNIMYVYDVRLQESSLELSVLTKDGLTVQVNASILYHPIRDVLPRLHKFVGPDYRRKLIYPIFMSSVRETVGAYRPEDLYTLALQQIQDEILVQAVEEMGRIPIAVDSVIVKRIVLPPAINLAIERKLTEEQAYLRYRYILLRTKEEVKRQVMAALGVARVQQLINQGLTENYLRLRGIEATTRLAESPNTKIVIVGGKDGLPIILNPDANMGGPKAPTGKAAPPSKPMPSPKPNAKAPKPAQASKADQEDGNLDWKQIWRSLSDIDALLSRIISSSEPTRLSKDLLKPGMLAPVVPPTGVKRADKPTRSEEVPGVIRPLGPGSYPEPPPPPDTYQSPSTSPGAASPGEEASPGSIPQAEKRR